MHKILSQIDFLIILFIAELFYGCFLIGIPFLVLLIPIRKRKNIQIEKNKIKEMGRKFSSALNSMAFAMEVGYSMENAVNESIKDMIMMYGEEDLLVHELKKISHKISVNIPIEQAFCELADQINNEDIKYFSNIISLSKRSGGNLISVINNTAKRISKKVEVENEINTIVSGKKMEQKIMSAIPYLIILYLRITASEFIIPLYGNLIGIVIMTVSLLVCIGANMVADKLLNIQV